MPLLRQWAPRKRWRYVGLYGPEVMLCAARAEIGPAPQSFWAVWDREAGRRFAHTRMRPGGHEVVMEGARIEVRGDEVRASLELGEAEPIGAVAGEYEPDEDSPAGNNNSG